MSSAGELSAGVAAAVLGGAALHAAWNALVKGSSDKELDTVAVAAGAGIVSLLAAFWLPVPHPDSWGWLAASTVLHIFYFRFLAGAYRWGELSYTYPIMRGGGPLIVALAGVFWLGEVLPAGQVAGMVLICAGILAFASGRHDPRATFFALANAAVIAAYTLVDGQGARASGAPVAYTLWFFAGNGIVVGAMGCLRRGAEVPRYLGRHPWRALAGGLCSVGSYGIALWAMTRAPVALVAVLRETAVIFGAVLGALFLNEKMTRRRLIATGAVLAGLVLLRL